MYVHDGIVYVCGFCTVNVHRCVEARNIRFHNYEAYITCKYTLDTCSWTGLRAYVIAEIPFNLIQRRKMYI